MKLKWAAWHLVYVYDQSTADIHHPGISDEETVSYPFWMLR
ncbi:hypothetical protein ACFOQM_03510 [Paenibacillus sp. GCM10012307]